MRQAVILAGLGIVLSWAGYLEASTPEASGSASQAISPYQAVLKQYCTTCHNETLKTAGLVLDKLDLENVSEGAPVWEKVVRKLRTGAMPPPGTPRLEQATSRALASHLETSIDHDALAEEIDYSLLLPPS